MTAQPSVVERAPEVLGEHQRTWVPGGSLMTHCSCGHKGSAVWFQDHQAGMLAAAGLLNTEAT